MSLLTVENDYGYIIKIKDNNNLLSEDILKKLQNFKFEIYFNNCDCYYWIFDFKIDLVWFESTNIDMNENIIELNAFI